MSTEQDRDTRVSDILVSPRSRGSCEEKQVKRDVTMTPSLDGDLTFQLSPSPVGFRLPRLTSSDQRLSPSKSSRNSDDGSLKFPEIPVCRQNGRLALNTSITDLLDPEMEIINKIKHTHRRRHRRRRRVHRPEPLLVPTEPDDTSRSSWLPGNPLSSNSNKRNTEELSLGTQCALTKDNQENSSDIP